jgi:hypothetical protein
MGNKVLFAAHRIGYNAVTHGAGTPDRTLKSCTNHACTILQIPPLGSSPRACPERFGAWWMGPWDEMGPSSHCHAEYNDYNG